ncbi:right-handed parallel beta-helix repeat-containing protein, partial [Fulvivirga kasyanovii]
MSNFLVTMTKPWLTRLGMFCFIIIFFISCAEDELLSESSSMGGNTTGEVAVTQTEGVAGCTDSRAINTGGASYDNNSCQYVPTACADCDYVVRAGDKVIDNDWINLPAGSTIGIKTGGREPIIFRNFHGTADKPFIFINCDGPVKISGDLPGIKLHNSSHIRLTGTGSADDYGIVVAGTRPFGVVAELGTTDFEIDHLEIKGTKSAGIAARTRPVCDGSTNRGTFVQRNTIIHHNYIHDVADEALYIGGSHWHTSFPTISECSGKVLYEPELEGVRIYNNRVENTGRDGIQVGSATRDCQIYNNEIINYGRNNITVHQSGIQINPGTVGEIYNNYIKGGTGRAIFLNGFDNQVYNNLIVDCSKDAIHIGDRNPPAGMSYRIVNNTLVNIKGYGVKMNSNLSVNNVFYNNVLVNAVGDVLKFDKKMDFDISNNFIGNNIEDAIFSNPQALDFSPVEGSPIVDSGLDMEEIDNVNIASDYLFHLRKSGQHVDIGAFERQVN